jgi:hypothetical protein
MSHITGAQQVHEFDDFLAQSRALERFLNDTFMSQTLILATELFCDMFLLLQNPV